MIEIPKSSESHQATGRAQVHYDTQKKAASLTRVRNNQRRSRARKKEYVSELEKKYRACQQSGSEASTEVQAAARSVLEENKHLRALLRLLGVPSHVLNSEQAIQELETLLTANHMCAEPGASTTSWSEKSHGDLSSDGSAKESMATSVPWDMTREHQAMTSEVPLTTDVYAPPLTSSDLYTSTMVNNAELNELDSIISPSPLPLSGNAQMVAPIQDLNSPTYGTPYAEGQSQPYTTSVSQSYGNIAQLKGSSCSGQVADGSLNLDYQNSALSFPLPKSGEYGEFLAGLTPV